ncbi:MAG: autotransporter domain-containing protein [Chlamydiales bacterium]|nr:autotransporter domain-containing protein [Chlamydiales bacterium]
MKKIFLLALLSVSTLFAQTAPFGSQSDLTADLSDAVLNGIYHHRLSATRYQSERSVWIEGFGSYRKRKSCGERSRYENGFGGILGGVNYALSCDAYLNFFIGGSWGGINIAEESNFDTNSIFFGTTWERICDGSFYGFAFLAGYLKEERRFRDVHEEPRGVFLSPEITYARQLDYFCGHPIFTSTLRYAGFFPRDYQYREIGGTLYVRERSVQLFTLRGELAFPLCLCERIFEPYIGAAGRFQFDGNRVKGQLLLDQVRFSDGIDNIIVYGLGGVRFSKQWNCIDLQANVEGSYDSDLSWRILGELSLNYRY